MSIVNKILKEASAMFSHKFATSKVSDKIDYEEVREICETSDSIEEIKDRMIHEFQLTPLESQNITVKLDQEQNIFKVYYSGEIVNYGEAPIMRQGTELLQYVSLLVLDIDKYGIELWYR